MKAKQKTRTKPTYDIATSLGKARFTYAGLPRVVRVISIDADKITGYQTRKGDKNSNILDSQVRSFLFSKINGSPVFTKR